VNLHIMQGQWGRSIPIQLPKALGHKADGWIEEVDECVLPASAPGKLVKGDLVLIFG
jgi:hypothetical protein